LLARLQSIPAHWWNETREASFPLVIGVGDSDIVKSANARLVQTLPPSVDTAGLRSALVRAESLVYTQKAQELSYLLRQYTSNAAPSMYLASIKVEHEGHKVPLDTRTIMAILASANYCRLHTDSGDYEIRETMNGISAKLDPTVFARIHRSVIVNTSQVREVALSNDVPRAVILRDGMELPVGPNFRHSLQELVLRKRA
jgi:DNA-binding LytR/AlgR family response regulator